jgi:hypothetical protein
MFLSMLIQENYWKSGNLIGNQTIIDLGSVIQKSEKTVPVQSEVEFFQCDIDKVLQ